MKNKVRITLGVFAVLAGLATVAGFLAAIWTGDERWSLTASVGIFVTIYGGMACAYPGWND